jgi:hypothetical protein
MSYSIQTWQEMAESTPNLCAPALTQLCKDGDALSLLNAARARVGHDMMRHTRLELLMAAIEIMKLPYEASRPDSFFGMRDLAFSEFVPVVADPQVLAIALTRLVKTGPISILDKMIELGADPYLVATDPADKDAEPCCAMMALFKLNTVYQASAFQKLKQKSDATDISQFPCAVPLRSIFGDCAPDVSVNMLEAAVIQENDSLARLVHSQAKTDDLRAALMRRMGDCLLDMFGVRPDGSYEPAQMTISGSMTKAFARLVMAGAELPDDEAWHRLLERPIVGSTSLVWCAASHAKAAGVSVWDFDTCFKRLLKKDLLDLNQVGDSEKSTLFQLLVEHGDVYVADIQPPTLIEVCLERGANPAIEVQTPGGPRSARTIALAGYDVKRRAIIESALARHAMQAAIDIATQRLPRP